MKLQSTGWKVPVFVGFLVVLALLIDFLFFNRAAARREAKAQEQTQAAAEAKAKQATQKLAKEEADAEAKHKRGEAEAKSKAAEHALTEHARFLARYLNSGFPRKAGAAVIGVSIESETGTMNPAIARALAERLGTNDTQVLDSFFKPDFVADKYADSILSGDTVIFDRLQLTNWLNGVLVGRQTVAYSTNSALENTITANVRLEVKLFPVGLARESQSWAFSGNGVGFNAFDARQLAEDRIIHRIASDPTMALSNFSLRK